jgi:nucleotide-binding universal stress UspA family protein
MSNEGGVRILFATDGSEGADLALDVLLALPLRPIDEVVVVSYPAFFLAARPNGTGLIARMMDRRRRAAREVVEAAMARLTTIGVPTSGVVQNGLDAVDAILRVVQDRQADLIVVGSRGLGLVSGLMLGSTARTLAMLSPTPVLVVRDRRSAPRRVLIAIDGSVASRAALQLFARLPLPREVTVELLHVLPAHDWSQVAPVTSDEILALRESFERDEGERARILLQQSAAALPATATVSTYLERGAVSDTILARAAAIGADLIVMGSRGLSGPRRPLWGSTAERVMIAGTSSMLIAPVPGEPAFRQVAVQPHLLAHGPAGPRALSLGKGVRR